MTRKMNQAPFASLPLNPRSPAPMHRQLYDGIRNAILSGALPPGTRLPATRALAADLGVSRTTVMAAFDQLLTEGYIEGRHGSGTYVSRLLPEELLQAESKMRAAPGRAADPPQLSNRGQVLAAAFSSFAQLGHTPRAFELGSPALDEFPVETWSRLVARRCRASLPELLGREESSGYRPLREAIAAYVGTARAVRCSAGQVIVVAGSNRAIDLIVRVLLNPGDQAWVEDPCYPQARAAFLSAGGQVVPIPVNEEGLDIDAGLARCPEARIAYVTPSHQYPTGVTMSLRRRLALLEWASSRSAWVLEDDYDSEYRYVGRPLASLQGLDRQGRVLYLESFSKVLFPALRLGYLVVPPTLVGVFSAAQASLGGSPPSLEQAVLADFITEGYFVRHVRRMRTLYAERQGALLRALQRELAGMLEVPAFESGMHLLGWLPEGTDDRTLGERAAKAGVAVRPLSAFYATPSRRGGLLLGFAALRPSQIRDGVRQLAAALRRRE
jgi:GntR family transcriptional regulator / MocR family aminotransferase